MKGTHCKCNYFTEQVFKSVSKSLVRSVSKNSCLLLILHVLIGKDSPCTGATESQMLGYRVLRTTASFKYLSLNIPRSAWKFALDFKRSRIQLPEASQELPWTLCECIHTEPCHSYSVPYTKPQGSCFWVSVMCSCSKVPARSMEGADSRLSKCFQIPLLLHAG